VGLPPAWNTASYRVDHDDIQCVAAVECIPLTFALHCEGAKWYRVNITVLAAICAVGVVSAVWSVSEPGSKVCITSERLKELTGSPRRAHQGDATICSQALHGFWLHSRLLIVKLGAKPRHGLDRGLKDEGGAESLGTCISCVFQGFLFENYISSIKRRVTSRPCQSSTLSPSNGPWVKLIGPRRMAKPSKFCSNLLLSEPPSPL
jgi:hypothetical protein